MSNFYGFFHEHSPTRFVRVEVRRLLMMMGSDRYRALLEASLADDQLLAMALLQPGWKEKYNERPTIFPVICIGRVVSHSTLDDGRYNLLLQGVRRATVVRELASTQVFRLHSCKHVHGESRLTPLSTG
jgi:Lon protease-like protein